ncbi:MAG: hypothetical protein RLZZ272_1375 [Actinomycetota bacterium]
MSGSAIYVGTVRHRRRRPRAHALSVRGYHVLIDVDELDRLERDVPGFGYRRRALTRFRDDDHFGPVDRPVREKLAAWLAEHDLELPEGPLRVLTNLRVLGHVFNPVSWWFAHGADGRLELVIAEVNSTFGDAHAYVLDDLLEGRDGLFRATATKVLHVSPFLPVSLLQYRFTILPPGDRVLVHMDVDDDVGTVLDATQDGRRRPFDGANLRRVLLRHPVMPLVTIAAIHWHALRLWLKRVPFHRRPVPPPDGFERPRGAQDDRHPEDDPSPRHGTDHEVRA